MTFKKLVFYCITLPEMVWHRFVDRVCIPIWLWLHDVKMGKGCRFTGFPVIRVKSGARIQLGHRVYVNSRPYTNTATIPHRTMISAIDERARIIIHDEVGLSGVSIVAKDYVEIGPRTQVGSGTVIWDTDFHPLDPEKRRIHRTSGAESAPIRIGADVFIGARCIILKGVTIGDGSVIGAGSVVTSSIPSGVIAAGNPARVIRSLKDKD